MPKHDFLTPKAISNRQKSIGLQKLRWYCQMCQKQCRDENGFKCHTTSEGHLRQMRLFSENPNHIIDDFSRDFERGFLEILSHRHGTKRVLANRVYQEYIGDKHHVHMNATMWSSLTGLCKYLGREGKAVVDETEKGWYIQYIDRDPKVLAKQLQAQERKQAELDDEERTRRMIANQIAAAAAREQALASAAGSAEGEDDEGEWDDEEIEGMDGGNHSANDEAEVHDSDGGADGSQVAPGGGSRNAASQRLPVEPVKVELKIGDSRKRSLKAVGFENEEESQTTATTGSSSSGDAAVKKSRFLPTVPAFTSNQSSSSSNSSSASLRGNASHIEQLMIDEDRRKAAALAAEDKKNRKDYWLQPGIVVKIMNKTVGDGKYYKLKGVVERVFDRYVGEVRVDGTLLRLDQEHLETVVPKVNCKVLIVNGRGRGLEATIVRFHEEKFNCDLHVPADILGGASIALANPDLAPLYTLFASREILGVEYEDICKLAD